MQVNCSDRVVVVVPSELGDRLVRFMKSLRGVEPSWVRVVGGHVLMIVRGRVTEEFRELFVDPLVAALLFAGAPHLVAVDYEGSEEPGDVEIVSLRLGHDALTELARALGLKRVGNRGAEELAREIAFYA